MADLLVVLNPRAIPECMASYKKLDIDVGYLTGYTEPQLHDAFSQLPVYDRYVVTSDDTIVEQKALDAVMGLLDQGLPVVTGYCGLDSTSPLVNLSKKPLSGPVPSVVSYDFPNRIEVMTHPWPAYRTYFAGLSLTAMHRDLWEAFPFQVTALGQQSDYSLSYRLQEAEIPIVAAREGWVHHCKERWNYLDKAPEKQLLIGKVEPKVRVERHGVLV